MVEQNLQDMGCRLAIRAEGEYVNAYYAEAKTMEGAILLGSIKRSIVDTHRPLFDEWREFMQKAFGKVAELVIGSEPVWGKPETAPEHELAGRA